MKIPQVSIIIPVYNAGGRLVECLDTLIQQTLRDIEFILVIDCPTDGSDKIAQAYAQKDDRIILVYNTENLHIGKSRNRGLEVARGEYIGFSDHDDYRELDMYEQMYDYAQNKHADIVISRPAVKREGCIELWHVPDIEVSQFKEYALMDLMGRGNGERDVSVFCNIHNVIYRRDLIMSNHIQFVDTRFIAPEDVLFNIETILCADTVVYLNRPFYYHLMLESSEGHSSSYSGWEKRGEGMNYLYQLLRQKHVFELYASSFYNQVTKQFLNSLLGVLYQGQSMKNFWKAYRILKSYSFTKPAFKQYKPDVTPRSWLKNKVRALFALLLTH